jgi:hydrogenase-4 component F
MLVILVLLPVAAAAFAGVAGWRRLSGWIGVASALGILVGGVVLAAQTVATGPVRGAGGLLRADALSAFMLVVIGVVGLLADVFAISYIDAELEHGHTTRAGARSYGVLVQLFHAAMVLAVLAANLGVMWVAVEATTISTVFLVGHRRTRASLEASWKYLIVGSVGIALAFLGTALLAFAGRDVPGASGTLDWALLAQAAEHLDPGAVRLAVGLLVLGYGTKVGLAPMHTWLPDAHSQAPAPVSAMMSGVLLGVAFHSLLRVKVIGDAALGTGFLRGLLVAAGLLSLVVSASLLLAQRDYKRMLAYHSIEHMGLIALGAAAGTPLAIGGVLLHILGHGLAKSVLFLTTGEMLLGEGTTAIEGVRALVARRPLIGGAFGVGLLALLGMPPFSLFVSELAMIRGQWAAGLQWVVAIQVVLMLVIFAAVTDHGRHMLLGAARDGFQTDARRTPVGVGATLVGGLAACAVLGLSAWPAETVIRSAGAILTGGGG